MRARTTRNTDMYTQKTHTYHTCAPHLDGVDAVEQRLHLLVGLHVLHVLHDQVGRRPHAAHLLVFSGGGAQKVSKARQA
jgi:hypothetical protein